MCCDGSTWPSLRVIDHKQNTFLLSALLIILLSMTDTSFATPAALVALLQGASIEERLRVGLTLVDRNLRGAFRYSHDFYRDPAQLACYHVNHYVPLFARVPDDWLTGGNRWILDRGRRVLSADTFDITHADPQCGVCQDHAMAIMRDDNAERAWRRKKLKEMGF
jgi:hypothetical protein